ncbi:MAG TPA: hypothetical protein VGN68_04245 [Sphingopyxis sp.]|jgi:hypothetical protein|uniref:hypothetical protein n=1 Tax=Sphingopyxis sp. TaxID=1908224 RepID=UPI002E113CF3|nr:hypothetical protein [Sphingopyxis sp.]
MTDEDRAQVLALADAVEDAEATASAVRQLFGHYFGLNEDFDAIEVDGLVSGFARLRSLADRPQ